MQIKRLGILVATTAIAMVMALAVAAMVATPVNAAVEASYATPALLTVDTGTTARTGNYTSPVRYIAGYGLMDYGGSLVAATGQTVTAKIQVSFNGTAYLDYVTIHNAVGGGTTSVVPAQAAAVGAYVRMVYTPVSSTLSYTPTFWVMFK